ncbi:MAG: hypothetical protein Q9201_000462 [Fulgogasparrea decipioides]
MVLDASSMSDSYDASPDTPDPYDTSTSTSSVTSDQERAQLPQPFPVIGPLFGYTEAYMSRLVASRLNYHAQALGRNPTQRERQAILYYSYKGLAYASYGMPVFVTLGLFRAYETREVYRWPLNGTSKTPDGWWDGERLRIMGKKVAEGSSARKIMHAGRAFAYGGFGYFLGRLFVTSFAATVVSVGELKDPRLRDFQQAVRTRSKLQRGDTDALKQSKDSTGKGNISDYELLKQEQQIVEKSIGSVSLGAGAGRYGVDAERSGGSNTGIMSDAQMQTQETRQQVSPGDSPTENRASTFQMDKVARQPNSFEDSFDDASPMAQSHAGGDQGGSAWDRIRRQAQTSSAGIKPEGQSWKAIQREQRQGSTTGDSFNFSSTDEERQLARDEAQSEFDARVERERQGGSFNENGGKRW